MPHFRIHASKKGGFDIMFLTDLPIKTGADIPIPIRETIVTIRVRHASISHVIVQVPEAEEKGFTSLFL